MNAIGPVSDGQQPGSVMLSGTINKQTMTRRGLIQCGAAAGGGLAVGMTMPMPAQAAASTAVTAWVTIATNEAVTILCGAQDMGQGVYSSLAQIVAEELRVDWTRVRVGPAPVAALYANPMLGGQYTAASSSVRGFFTALLHAGAGARILLVTAGAAALGVAVSDCTVAGGVITSASTGKSITYGAVAAAAALLTPPTTIKLLSRAGFTLVGQPVARPDIPSKVNGTAQYGMDVVVPKMLFGAVRLCPTLGGTVASAGAPPPGFQLVNLGTGIAVIMNLGPGANTWGAIQASKQVSVKWTLPADAATRNTADILAQAQTLLTTGTPIVAEAVGDVAAAQAGAAQVLSFTYTLPYLPHATMEPLNCTASVTKTACTVWAPTQAPGSVQLTAAAVTGLPPSAVTVHQTLMGGGLGRKLEQDFVAYAVMAAKAVKVPVQLVWPREQDFTQDQYRPLGVCQVTAGLDGAGNIVSWVFRNVSPSILQQRGYIADGQVDGQATEGAVAQPYHFRTRQMEWVRHPAAIPVGFWRSVGHSINAFAMESAIDEVALALGADPVAYRKGLLGKNTRAIAVLQAAATLGGWGTPAPAGTARGVAYHDSFGSLAACVVLVTKVGTAIKVLNVACAVDCGTVINPDTATQQIEGGIIHGLNAALWGQMKFTKGVAQSSNFDTYRMARMADTPAIQVSLLQGGHAIGGLGEVGVPCMAPALANAWAALTGKRVRSLPLSTG